MKIVLHPRIDGKRYQMLCEAAHDIELINTENEDVALREIRDADGFYGKMTPSLLAAASQLRWVQSPTASLEHYVFPALVEHDCVLTNMRGLYSDVIADQVLGYVLCFARNLHLYIRLQLQRRWQPIGAQRSTPDYASGQAAVTAMDSAHLHVADCTMGIVGLGAIGAEIGRRAKAFGMRVVAVDPSTRERPQWVDELSDLSALDAVLAHSDFVVVAAPHTPDTAGMFQQAQFKTMKPTAYFINIGRGAIVSLDALVSALRDGDIAGAALDVYEIEPLPEDHPLWMMDNVILTPHIAGASVHIADRHDAVLLENLGRFARHEPLINVVDKAAWY